MKQIFYDAVTAKFTFTEFVAGRQNKSVIPPKYSPTDKFGKYRRLAKAQSEE